jgi:hypothetical protein
LVQDTEPPVQAPEVFARVVAGIAIRTSETVSTMAAASTVVTAESFRRRPGQYRVLDIPTGDSRVTSPSFWFNGGSHWSKPDRLRPEQL